jgi:hypothetical protein
MGSVNSQLREEVQGLAKQQPLNILFMGRFAQGKSSAANTMLRALSCNYGYTYFVPGAGSTTQTINYHRLDCGVVLGTKVPGIVIFDMPGLTFGTPEELALLSKILKGIKEDSTFTPTDQAKFAAEVNKVVMEPRNQIDFVIWVVSVSPTNLVFRLNNGKHELTPTFDQEFYAKYHDVAQMIEGQISSRYGPLYLFTHIDEVNTLSAEKIRSGVLATVNISEKFAVRNYDSSGRHDDATDFTMMNMVRLCLARKISRQ